MVPLRPPYFLWACNVGLSIKALYTIGWTEMAVHRDLKTRLFRCPSMGQLIPEGRRLSYTERLYVGQQWWRYHDLCVHFNKNRLCQHLFWTRVSDCPCQVSSRNPPPRSEEGRGRAIRSPFRTLALAYPKLCVPPVDDEAVHRNWENLIAFLVNVIYMKFICSPPEPSKENLGWSSPRGDWDLSRLWTLKGD